MARFGFVGPSYVSQSPNQNAEECINWYVENEESGDGRSARSLYPAPGLLLFATLPDGPSRGGTTIQARTFVVSGSKFCEVLIDGTLANQNDVANDNLPAYLAPGQSQVLIASGGRLYVFDFTTNVYTPIPPATFQDSIGNNLQAAQVAYCDGYFFVSFQNSGMLRASNLNDATTWNALSFTVVTVFPDNVIGMLVDHRELWLWSGQKAAVYVNSGAGGGILGFPFVPVTGTTIEVGTAAAAGQVKLDNTIFWLGADERGNGIGWKAAGYTPIRVTSHAVEFDIQNKTISDAISYSYQDQGHAFWVIYFPSQNKTWVYDVATGLWHKRAWWNSTIGRYTAHRSRFHTFNFGKHLVGDWLTGSLWDMSITYLNDFGGPIRRLRRAPHIANEGEYIYHSELRLDLETGLGPQPPLTGTYNPDMPPAPDSVIIADSSDALWKLTVDDTGLLSDPLTAVATGTPQTIILKDDSLIPTTAWQVGASLIGNLTTIPIAYLASYQQTYEMLTTPSGIRAVVEVNNLGLLQTDGVFSTLPARDPQIMLRWSDDGGHTWSMEHIRNCGQSGNFRKRVRWGVIGGLGRARDRIYEISCTDAIPWRIIDAYLEAGPDFTKKERLSRQIAKVS